MLKQFAIVATTILALAGAAHAEPLEPPVEGPKQLCFKYSVFSLNADERVTDFSGSMEGLRIAIKGPVGTYEIAESEIFKRPGEEKRLVYSERRTNVYRLPGHDRQYEIEGPTVFSEGKDWPLMRISGSALRGSKRDVEIFRRIEVRNPKFAKCEYGFTYGFVP